MSVVSDSLDASWDTNNNGVMEPAENAAIENVKNVNGKKNNIDNKERMKKKKKAGPFSFFRAALVALRTDNKKKSTSTKVVDKEASNGKWKKIVGSMRPLHLQDNKSPPRSLTPPSPARSTSDESFDAIHRFHVPSSSPACSSISGGTMSQYASASNLQELDFDRDDDDVDVVFDAIRGDEMIDSKAEEFIAQFYQQMKIDRHHHHQQW